MNHHMNKTGDYGITVAYTENFCPVLVTQILSLCPEARGFLNLSKLERVFSPPLNTPTNDSKSIRYKNLSEIMKISAGIYQVWS